MELQEQEQTETQEQEKIIKVGVIEVKYLLEVVKAIKELTGEATFKFNSDGLNVVIMDCANVSLLNAVIKNSAFIEYGEAELSLNVEELYNLLKEHKKEIVSLKINRDKLILSFCGGFISELKLIDEITQQKTPELSYTTELTINTKEFKEAVRQFYAVAESLYFEATEQGLNLFSENSRITLKAEYSKNNKDKSRYSMEYLIKFIKTAVAENTTLKFNKDYPLSLEQETTNFKFNWILAPRVCED